MVLNCVKAFKEKAPLDNAYKHLAVVLASKILTIALLFNANTYMGNTPSVAPQINSLISFTVFHFVVCFSFDTFMSFRRGKVSIFIARIILSFGFYLPLLMLQAFNNLYLVSDNVSQGFIYHFVDMNFSLVANASNGFFMSSYILSTFSLLCMLALISTAYFMMIFFTSSYFGGMPKFKRFRIVFYMSTVTCAILSTMFLVSSLVEAHLFTTFLDNGKIVSVSSLVYLEFALSMLLIGVSVATFNIYHKANSRLQLEEKTTKI